MELKYSSKMPCVEGWYWCKNPSGYSMIVYLDNINRLVYPNTKIRPEVISIPFEDIESWAEWVGPIPEPESE